MKLLDILSEVQIIDTNKDDQYLRDSLKLDKYYILLQLLTKELLIGPFENKEEANHYMETKTTNRALRKIVIKGHKVTKFQNTTTVDEAFYDEASYAGNLGAMEMFKFQKIATKEQKIKMKELLTKKKNKEVWDLLQKVLNTKLQPLH